MTEITQRADDEARKGVAVSSVLTDGVGAFVAARGRTVRLDAGTPLFFEGDRSESVYACVDGRIRLFLTLPSGRELVMGIKRPGEAFGELSAIDHRPRAASAVAVDDSVVVHLPGDRFLSELHHEPELAIAVLRGVTDQLRVASARLRARNAESLLVRTAHLLIELSMLHRRHAAESGRIELHLSQAEVAEWIGATREATARALARLRRAGVLTTGRELIVIDDLPGLVRLAESD